MFYYVIFSSFIVCIFASLLLIFITNSRKLKMGEEIRYGAIGSIWFGFIAWICVYLAQYKPIVDPITGE